MRLIDENGYVSLLNTGGIPTIVARVKYGVTYGSKNSKDMITPCLTIYTSNDFIEDKFLFYDVKTIPFTHLQSKILNPYLMKIYLKLLTNKNDYSLDNFLSIIIADYFLNYLGYSTPNLMPLNDELVAN